MPKPRILKTTRAAVTTLVSVVVLQGLFGLQIAAILFYRTGAYFLDAGFYVYAVGSERAPHTPVLVAQAWGDNVFKTHTTISPMIILALIRLMFSIPVNFVLYLGLQHALASLAAGAIVGASARMLGANTRRSVLAAAGAAALLPFSNIAMGSLAYPHVELLGASCMAIGIVLLSARWMWNESRWILPAAILLFLVGILAREDLGGQLAITAAAAAVCGPWHGFRSGWRTRALVLVGGGAGATITLLLFQKFVMHSKGAFQISYSGTPPYHHISSVWYLVETVLTLLANRLDLVVSLVVFVAAAVVFKRRELLAYPLAFLPWLLLNVTSVDPSKRVLGIYLMFPAIIYMTAPVLAVALRHGTKSASSEPERGSDEPDGATVLTFSYVLAVVALFLGGISAPPTGGGYVYYSMLRRPLVGPGEIRLTNKIIRDYASERGRKGVDDPVMSLNPVDLEGTPLLSNVEQPATIDSMLFVPGFVLGEANVRRILQDWTETGRRISMKCLPGGIVRADAGPPSEWSGQTTDGQFAKALRCHPTPHS